jgi:hypothetical protein
MDLAPAVTIRTTRASRTVSVDLKNRDSIVCIYIKMRHPSA